MSGLIDYNNQRAIEHRAKACWAPEKSMFIALKGLIYTCCYNKTYALGKYPEQSLKEIWFSQKREKLSKHLQENDFSLGCQNCLRIIDAGNFQGLPAKNFDHLPLSDAGYPTKIDFELSNECNLECIMCRGEFSSAIRKNREKLPPIEQPYGEDFLSEIEEFIPHLKKSHFLGGEPFLIPIYEELWEKIHSINPQVEISVQTNATILTNRIKERLDSMRFNIAVSIDSIDEENYESIRKNGRFNKVIENIHYLREYCQKSGTDFTLSYCPMPQNWKELEQITAFANELDCKIYFNKVDFPRSCSFQSLEKPELDSILAYWRKADLPTKTKNEAYNLQAFLQVIAQVEYLSKQGIKSPKKQNLEQYLDAFKSYLETNFPEKAEQDFDKIRQKIHFILDAYRQKRANAEAKLLEIDFQSLYDGLRQSEEKHALHLFNTFIYPMPHFEK